MIPIKVYRAISQSFLTFASRYRHPMTFDRWACPKLSELKIATRFGRCVSSFSYTHPPNVRIRFAMVKIGKISINIYTECRARNLFFLCVNRLLLISQVKTSSLIYSIRNQISSNADEIDSIDVICKSTDNNPAHSDPVFSTRLSITVLFLADANSPHSTKRQNHPFDDVKTLQHKGKKLSNE